MRLIDADALCEKLETLMTRFCALGNKRVAEDYNFVMTVVDDAPTVDAVPVVRCKDCNQWCRNSGIADSPNGHCFYHDIDTNGCDFCSYGERRNNGIEYAPIVDAVPVVRCKDCKHLRTHKRCYTCPKRVGTLPDDLMSYCSEGEREDTNECL